MVLKYINWSKHPGTQKRRDRARQQGLIQSGFAIEPLTDSRQRLFVSYHLVFDPVYRISRREPYRDQVIACKKQQNLS